MNDRLEEEVTDSFGSYQRVWTCAPPDVGVGFVVVRDGWDADYTVRTIHEVRLA